MMPALGLGLILMMNITAQAQRGELDRYQQLVAEYREGLVDPVREIARWNADRVQAALASVGGPDRSGTLPQPRGRLAAAMLHTDAALGLLKAAKAADAHHHLYTAARLIDEAMTAAPDLTRIAQRWYITAEGYARAFHAEAWAIDLHERARTRFKPSPAQDSFERGLKAELAGTMAGPASRLEFTGAVDGISLEAIRWFVSAGRDYEEALELDPGFFEAALHLGRVRILAQQAEAAIAPLERAALAPERRISYLARLFRAAVAERAADFTGAEALYREALATFKWGQSAPLALAQLLSRTGREPEAREVLARHMAGTGGRVTDPLWSYLILPGDQLGVALDDLRAEVWR
jgi:tetratricopeptide (TPR) repeat protein